MTETTSLALQTISVFNGWLPDQADEGMSLFISVVQWSAIVLSVLAGLEAARKHGMDFYGTLVIGFISAIGGGTVRDLLLGRPVFWVANPVYAITVLVIAVIRIPVLRRISKGQFVNKAIRPVDWVADEQSKLFLTIDALALGLWAYLGTVYALKMDLSLAIAPIMGVITASFGAVIRDMFFAKVPQLFLPGQLYAMAAAAGAVAYTFMWWVGYGGVLGFAVCILLSFGIRIASVIFNIRT